MTSTTPTLQKIKIKRRCFWAGTVPAKGAPLVVDPHLSLGSMSTYRELIRRSPPRGGLHLDNLDHFPSPTSYPSTVLDSSQNCMYVASEAFCTLLYEPLPVLPMHHCSYSLVGVVR